MVLVSLSLCYIVLASITIQAYYFNNSSEIRHDSIQGGVHPWSFCSYLKQRLLSRSTGCFQMHFVSVVLNKKIAAGRSDLRWTSRSTLSQFSSSFSGTPTTFSDPSSTFSLHSRFLQLSRNQNMPIFPCRSTTVSKERLLGNELGWVRSKFSLDKWQSFYY